MKVQCYNRNVDRIFPRVINAPTRKGFRVKWIENGERYVKGFAYNKQPKEAAKAQAEAYRIWTRDRLRYKQGFRQSLFLPQLE